MLRCQALVATAIACAATAAPGAGQSFDRVREPGRFERRVATGFLRMQVAVKEAVDRPSAALVADLRQRGLLDTTVVHWGGEMGRLPVRQNDKSRETWGRDHNTYGFSQWVAGGGFKAGHVHGETDEWSHKAVKDVVHHYDWHATLLHCFGLDHARLSFSRAGVNATLTDRQEARIVGEILA
jgi:hypothetical protein